MQVIRILASAVVLSAAASTASADVNVTIANGRVSVVATNATLQQILAEWARVGQTNIVNLERIPGGPVTLELRNVPEEQALDILLRPVTGFIAAPRPADAATLSRFDRIVVMPTMATPRAPVGASAAPMPMPTTFTPATPPFPGPEQETEERTAQPAQGPVFNTFPQPQVTYPGNPAQGAYPGPGAAPQYGPNGQPIYVQQPGATPTASPFGGVAVPGMIVAPPQQPGAVGQPPVPGQVLQPGQTPQIKRPGGEP